LGKIAYFKKKFSASADGIRNRFTVLIFTSLL
jgi:hypothetical protein